jgi:hypothetical protein
LNPKFGWIKLAARNLTLQSDWISYALGAWAAGGEFSLALQQILPKISYCGFDELGRMGRCASPGTQVEYFFPDLPIELRLAPTENKS